jgi:predicted permease
MLAISLKGVIRAADRLSPSGVFTFQVTLPAERYATDEERNVFYQQTLQRLRGLPQVESVSLGTALPYGDSGRGWESIALSGESLQDHLRYTERYWISPEYLKSLRVPLASGRIFSDADATGSVPVAVVNQSFAARFFPGQNALGQRIHLGPDPSAPWITIIGTSGDVPMAWMDRSAQPTVYLSFAQFPQPSAVYVIRTNGDSASLFAPVREAISNIDRTLPIESMETYADYLHDAFIVLRFASGSLIANAAAALLLAVIGIFGVIATMVVERSREIGVRLALGASPNAILRWILRESMALTTVGILTGVPFAFLLSRLVAHFLYTTFTGEGEILVITSLLVIALAQFAALIPALRAAAVDPVRVLRSL